MDTRYWGPSGWRLLHSQSFAARGPWQEFFKILPYILPCKYCRRSLSEYMTADPVPTAAADLPRWLYRIHNQVNAKLRRQKLAVAPNPTYAQVERIYTDRLAAGCSRTQFEGWEFLFSVAEAHPLSRAGRASHPFPDAPKEEVKDPLERNRWNLMTPEERLPYYTKFWSLLPTVFPFPEWTAAWMRAQKGGCGDSLGACRKDCLQQIWKIRCAMEKELELLNKTTYSELCRELRSHRSGCGRSTRGKTCRKKRGTR
jgi:hypothetical protein